MDSQLQEAAEQIVTKFAGHRLTLHTFLPTVTLLIEHASEFEHLAGPQKKQLVLLTLQAVASRLPPPENEIAGLVVRRLGPVAVDTLVDVAKATEEHWQVTERVSITQEQVRSQLITRRRHWLQVFKLPPGQFLSSWKRTQTPPKMLYSSKLAYS